MLDREPTQVILERLGITKKFQIDKYIEAENYIKNLNKKEISFTMNGIQKPASRPRYRRSKKIFYVPGAKLNKDKFRKFLKSIEYNEPLIDTQCDIALYYYLKIPFDFTKIENALALKGLYRPIKTPDWDNLAKTTDMFEGLLWTNDCIVVGANVQLYYSDTPRTEVNISYLHIEDKDNRWNKRLIKSRKHTGGEIVV